MLWELLSNIVLSCFLLVARQIGCQIVNGNCTTSGAKKGKRGLDYCAALLHYFFVCAIFRAQAKLTDSLEESCKQCVSWPVNHAWSQSHPSRTTKMLENDLLQYLQSHSRTPLQILCCPVYTWPEEFESASLHFVDREITLWCHLFEKLCFQNVLYLHYNAKPVFSDSSGLKYVFEKLRFRDRLVWTLCLTVERKLRFQITPAQCREGLGEFRVRIKTLGVWWRGVRIPLGSPGTSL